MVLIQTRASLISAGTERMLVDFGKSSLLAKARSQPDKVRQVLDKIATDGLLPTLEAVRNRLDEPLPLGYCNAGVVVEVGPGVSEFKPGDRAASNGPHAETVAVPKNLCAKIPDAVPDEHAAFTALASVGLQGIRLASPAIGERVAVIGLGLIGLATVQLLRASGCQVLGVDPNPKRLRLAEQFGARTVDLAAGGDPVAAAAAWTNGRGVDAVLITASARNDSIVHQAAEMSRKRGRIVLVGVADLNLRRSDFYQKELSFQVSCSYGPGRYDERYEQGGQDYPFAFVRWTEQRNFEAVLEAMASGTLQVGQLITHRFPIDQAAAAYQAVASNPEALGVILEYPGKQERCGCIQLRQLPAPSNGEAVVAVIGAGNFSKMTLLPALSRTRARIRYVADLNGAAARHSAAKHGAELATTDYRDILGDPAVDAVLIAVGHNLHARMACEALASGKHVFVEKPLAMNVGELAQVMSAAAAHPDRLVMVGFNRRFSPHAVKMKQLLRARSQALAMTMTVNAGSIPASHWVHDPERGGGRIVGEACHFIDLMVFLCGAKVSTVSASSMGRGRSLTQDTMAIVLEFEDGSAGSINYFANGSKAFPKEQLEVFSEGRVLELDNFRRTTGYGFSGFRRLATWRQDKGHRAEVAAFVEKVASGGEPLIALDELVNVTLASFAAVTAANERRTVELDEEYAAQLSGARV